MNKEQIQNALRENVQSFVFTKVNGESRKMQGTLDPAFIPLDDIPVIKTDAKPVMENVNIVRCYDVDVKAWRSFRVDSLIEFAGEAVVQCKTL